MTRVLHIITRFIRGGADEETLLTVTRLDPKKYNITLAYGKEFHPSMVRRAQQAGIRTHGIPLRHLSVISYFQTVIHLAFYIRKKKFIIVHTHSTEAGIIGRWAAYIAGTPCIVHTVHGIAFSPHRSGSLNWLILSLERLTARITTILISTSDMMRRMYIRQCIGRAQQYRVIYSGIDFRYFSTLPVKERKGKHPVITLIGRIDETKGHDTFIDAAHMVLQKRRVEFWIVGEGPLQEEIAADIRRRGLEKQIILHGYRDDIPRLISASDVIVVPSRWEGTTRVIPEAFALKKPVIASAVGGIPEIVRDHETGLLVPANEPALLAERVIQIIDDPALGKKLGRNGHREIAKFDITTCVHQLDALYSQLLQQKHIYRNPKYMHA